jgi:hypothetical protein
VISSNAIPAGQAELSFLASALTTFSQRRSPVIPPSSPRGTAGMTARRASCLRLWIGAEARSMEIGYRIDARWVVVVMQDYNI